MHVNYTVDTLRRLASCSAISFVAGRVETHFMFDVSRYSWHSHSNAMVVGLHCVVILRLLSRLSDLAYVLKRIGSFPAISASMALLYVYRNAIPINEVLFGAHVCIHDIDIQYNVIVFGWMDNIEFRNYNYQMSYIFIYEHYLSISSNNIVWRPKWHSFFLIWTLPFRSNILWFMPKSSIKCPDRP